MIDMEVIYLSQVPATDRVLVLIARTHCAIRKFLGRGLGLRWGGGSSGPGSAGAAQASYLDWGALVLVSRRPWVLFSFSGWLGDVISSSVCGDVLGCGVLAWPIGGEGANGGLSWGLPFPFLSFHFLSCARGFLFLRSAFCLFPFPASLILSHLAWIWALLGVLIL